MTPTITGAALGLGAAFLFGISTPLAKMLLQESHPLLIAGLLYLGAGLGLFVLEFFQGSSTRNIEARRETPLRFEDLGLLLAILVTGGILGPVLMLYGLQRLSAVPASLLLNLEAPLTILLAVTFFREHLGRREAVAVFLIVAGVGVLSYSPGAVKGDWVGAGAIAAACLCWAIDNNLTQRLSLRDPITLVRFKTLTAGTCTLALAMATGQKPSSPSMLMYALALGFVSYGVSVVLDTYALRILGAAREAAYFATAPFIGAVTAIPLLGERWHSADVWASGIMGVGVFLLLSEHHSHAHIHEEMEHDHSHVHSDHHDHQHDEHAKTVEPHAHLHRHLPFAHDHPHLPELHHRHRH